MSPLKVSVESKEINNILRDSPANDTMDALTPLTDFEFAINEGVRLCREGDYGSAAEIASELCGRAGLRAEQLVRAAILSAMVAREQRRYKDARYSLRGVGSLVRSCSTVVQAKYANLLGAAHYHLKEYDQAFDQYTAASVLYEMAGDVIKRWIVENNIALILIDMGKIAEAFEHLEPAAASCDDPFIRAQINDTYARAKLAEGIDAGELTRLMEALDYAMASVTYFKNAGELGQLEASAKTLRLVCEQIETHREGERIREALDRAGGSVSRAAVLLGVHHKTLSDKLNFKKYKRVKDGRKPERVRRKSLIKTPA